MCCAAQPRRTQIPQLPHHLQASRAQAQSPHSWYATCRPAEARPKPDHLAYMRTAGPLDPAGRTQQVGQWRRGRRGLPAACDMSRLPGSPAGWPPLPAAAPAGKQTGVTALCMSRRIAWETCSPSAMLSVATRRSPETGGRCEQRSHVWQPKRLQSAHGCLRLRMT